MSIVKMIASLYQLSGWLPHYANCQDCLNMTIVRMIASLCQLSGWLPHYANYQDDCLIMPIVRTIVSLCQLSGWLPHYLMPIVRMIVSLCQLLGCTGHAGVHFTALRFPISCYSSDSTAWQNCTNLTNWPTDKQDTVDATSVAARA
jgi:hypothetical protein